MIEDLYKQIIPHISEKDYLLYGHSMGTLLGYELTKKIIKNGLAPPCCLFFTGRGGPSNLPKERISKMSKDLFWEKIHQIGGLPNQILEYDELMELYYPVLKADFQSIEAYQYSKLKKPIPIPIYICMGKDEIGNAKYKTSMGEIENWGHETSLFDKPKFFEGNHFFIFQHPKIIAQELSDAYDRSIEYKQ
jgi:surfactin synthase thioesterase subunit